MRQSERRHR